MIAAASRYSTIVACDAPGCQARFVTGSYRFLARRQAIAEKWARVPPWTLGVEDSPRRRLDACPPHGETAIAEIRVRDEARAALREARAKRRQERWDKIRAEREAAELAASAEPTIVEPTIAEPTVTEPTVTEPTIAEPTVTEPTQPSSAAEGTARDRDAPGRPRERGPRAVGPSNLDVVERILRTHPHRPLTVAEIVDAAVGDLALPTQSLTPRTVVSRDLAIDVKRHGDASRFVRTAPGTFALRHPSPSE